MRENRGKMKILKAMMAVCLILNNFSGIGAIVKAATIEQNEINSSLNNNNIEEDMEVDDSVGENESEETIPTLPDNEGSEGGMNGEATPDLNLPGEDNATSDEEQPPITEEEKPLEPSEDLEDSNEDQDDENLEEPEEELVPGELELDEEEVALLSLDSRSAGSGLIQLWQVVPDGQQSKEGKTTSEIMKALQCKPNHNLYPLSGGQSEHNTYVNSCYVDDAFYLGEDSNYYHIYLSGYEGKVPKSESHWFELDLNNDGKKVSYEIRTVAYYIPGASTYAINEIEEKAILDVPELNFYDETLDKYNDFDEMGIELYSISTVQSPSYYANDNGTLYHYITSNVTKANSYSKVTVGKAPSWMSQGVKYYSYDGIYFYTNWRNIRVNGQGAVNQNNPFYNYYQYLPFRSKSNYAANIFNNYTNSNGGAGGKLVNTGQYFYAVQDKYGINGALQYAMGIHESGWGKSSLSMDKNNLFGMNATDNNPYGNGTSFPSVEAGINYHADRYLSWGYTDPIDDWRYFGSHVGNKGSGMNVKYASDPFWGEKIAGWYYRFDNASGLKDYNYYTIGIKQSNVVVDIKSQANSGSSTLYQTKNKKSNFKIANYPFLIIGAQNGFYKVKTDTPIVNGTPKFSAQYNWDTTNGYIPTSAVVSNTINNYNYKNPGTMTTVITYTGRMTDMYWQNDRLIVKGYGELSTLEVPWWSSVTHDIIFVNKYDQKEYKFSMNPVYSDWLAGDPHGLGGNYGYAQYEGTLNLNSLPFGEYDVYHETTVKGYTHRESLMNNAQLSLPSSTTLYSSIYSVSHKLVDGVYPISLTKYPVNPKYVGRLSDISLNGNVLSIGGYGELQGLGTKDSKKVNHHIVLINKSTKKEYTFKMNNEYSSWLASDPHGLGGNYAYSQYNGKVDLSLIDYGEYDVYHETIVQGYTYRNLLMNNAKLKLPVIDSGINQIYVTDQLVNGEYPVSITKKLVTENLKYTGRIMDIQWNNNSLYLQGYGEVPLSDYSNVNNVKHEIVLVNKSTSQEYTYNMNPEYNSWLASDPHGLGGNYAYAQYSGNIDFSSITDGNYDMYHQVTVSGKQSRELLFNNAKVTLPSTKLIGSIQLKVEDYNKNNEYPMTITKTSGNAIKYVGRASNIQWSNNQLNIEGYGEVAGLIAPNSDSLKHEIVLVNQATKEEYKYTVSSQYSSWLASDPHGLGGSYAYAQYSGTIDISNIKDGNYDVYHQVTSLGQTHRSLLVNNAQIELPEKKLIGSISIEINNKIVNDQRPIIITKASGNAIKYVGRVSNLTWSGDELKVEGYGEVAGLVAPTADSIRHEIVLVNKTTKQEYNYRMISEYSSWLAGDPHGLGGSYAYAQYSGNINLTNIEDGRYEIYHQITSSGQTYRMLLVNNARIDLPTNKVIGSKKIEILDYNKEGEYPVELIKQ